MHKRFMFLYPVAILSFFLLTILSSACGKDDDEGDINEPELITTVELSIGDGSGLSATYTWTDPEGDGNPVIDPIELSLGTTYTGIVEFFDRSGSNNTSFTMEIEEEDVDHLVCYNTSGGLSAPVPDDVDRNNDPLGLSFSWVTGPNAGSGNLIIRLKHLPNKGAVDPCVTGDTDVEVSFPVMVF